MKKSRLMCAVFTSLSLTVGSPVFSAALELITNGGFETGDFTGWTINELAGSSGSYFIDDGDGLTPLSTLPTVGPATGAFYAVSDNTGPGTHALSQTFTVAGPVPSAILSFDMFVNWNNPDDAFWIDPIGLDHTGASRNLHARVDILTSSASAFDTGAGVLANFYIGADPGFITNPYITYLFDITSVVGSGGTFSLRFADTTNYGNLNQGVDNVSIQVVPISPAIYLFGTGLLGLVGMARRRKQS